MPDPASLPDPALHDRSMRRALTDMPHQSRAAWRTRYLADDGAELRAMAVLERTDAAIRNAGEPATIRTLWITLADRAVTGDPDVRAAAALAGMALGLGTS